MNHRFIINVALPEGATVCATGRPLTRDQVEAIACAQLMEQLHVFCTRATIPRGSICIVTEAAPAREEGGKA